MWGLRPYLVSFPFMFTYLTKFATSEKMQKGMHPVPHPSQVSNYSKKKYYLYFMVWKLIVHLSYIPFCSNCFMVWKLNIIWTTYTIWTVSGTVWATFLLLEELFRIWWFVYSTLSFRWCNYKQFRVKSLEILWSGFDLFSIICSV